MSKRVYSSILDKIFTNKKGIFYLRFMDDVIVLIETQRQYAKARKRLFAILKELRLKISPHKTRMGRLEKGFVRLSDVVELYGWKFRSERLASHRIASP